MGIFSRLLRRPPPTGPGRQEGDSGPEKQADGTSISQASPDGVAAPGLVLKKNEICYCLAEAALMEEKVERKRIKGRSVGASFRVGKRLSLRTNSFDGEIVPESALVPVAVGRFFITNQRVIFLGDKKSLNIRLGSLLGIQLFLDGLRLTDSRGKPRVIKFFSDDEVREVKAVLPALFEGEG